jgi:hypothetical protein
MDFWQPGIKTYKWLVNNKGWGVTLKSKWDAVLCRQWKKRVIRKINNAMKQKQGGISRKRGDTHV